MINKNDNLSSSWLRMGDRELREYYAPFMPIADWLIAKHCKQWWKTQPQTSEYQAAQHGLCSVLFMPRSSKEMTCRFLVIYLGCDVLPLMNDPETLERIPEFTPAHMELARKISQM